MAQCRRGRKHKEWYIGLGRPFHDHALEGPFNYSPEQENLSFCIVHGDNVRNGVPLPTNISTDAMAVLNSMTSLGDVPPSLDRLQILPTPLNQPPEDIPSRELPAYFQSFPKHFTDADISYLRSKGALNIPHKPLRNETIRCYFEYIHPYLPLLDPLELLVAVDGSRSHHSGPQLSLLLFHSVMFAAVPFVDEPLVREAGYANLKTARKAFFEKSKLLYDVDFECDSITIIQSVLLMSFWSDRQTQDAHKQTWHWVNIAISLAQTVGLNQDPESLPLPQRKKSLRKRLWWCCFMRDRVISLYMSRPMRIRREDFDVPLPTLEDIEIDSPSVSLDLDARSSCLVHLSIYDRTAQIELAEIFISFLKLCIVIGTILSAQYSPLRRPSGSPNRASRSGFSALLFPVHSPGSEQTVTMPTESVVSPLESTLREWYNSLPPSAYLWRPQPESRPPQWTDTTPEDIHRARDCDTLNTDNPRPPSVVIQRAILHMCYYTAVSALHRCKRRSRHSQNQVSDSACNIARISAFLNDRGLVRYLPVTAITMLVPSIITNALLVKSISQAPRPGQGSSSRNGEMVRARDNVNSLLVSLKTLQRVYVAADWVALLVEAMLNRAKIKIVVPQPDGLRLDAENETRHRAFELDVQNVSIQSCKTTAERNKPTPVTINTLAGQSQGLQPGLTLSADLRGPDMNGCANDGDGSWQDLISPTSAQMFGSSTDESPWYSIFSPENSDSLGQWNFGSLGIDGFGENVDGMIPWDGTGVDWIA
ncbi:uncharacterized protein A1O5_04489 [Cladophialophora psammophila CBS 110553]|uniref:Xylanolytic transcriptional activator regulatory domain-containing protein n=1 Tax=Cladophialophora psammophila CBS 110553 TaxID=1182543 RepID=W9X4Z2_9EURO|nr:uncharacterized protein A1O5_04489 [Cladophialophora psammophila CBS 110553]EXJ71986.1 hypothetical protein A1O5_04489 [Cladophialophora psammophila CBS 110553]